MQIVISVTASMIYFFLSPVKEASSELLARTSPTFFDVMIAFFGGLAGIIGQTREDKVTNMEMCSQKEQSSRKEQSRAHLSAKTVMKSLKIIVK